MNINFELYKVFYEVANERSISKGAEKLLISQPAVTQSIKTLEAELGGQLFIRTPKGVVLTEEGQVLYNYISEGMRYFINGSNKFTSLKELNSGNINIGATTIISEQYLMPYLKEFNNLYPNISINIVNDLTDNLIKKLRNGDIDILIMSINNEDNIKDLDITPITNLHDIFVGNIKYKDKQIKNILNEDLLLQKYPSVTRSNFNNYLKSQEISCIPKMEVVSHSLLTSLVENGFGIGLLTKEFISSKLNNTLFEIKTNIKIPTRKLVYATKSNSVPSFTTTKFIELLKKDLTK
jgi:DNA-binding transcriptional LysR family regulator